MKKLVTNPAIVAPIIIFVVVILIIGTIDGESVDEMYQREERIEQVIREYAVACYAQEGAYPSDLAYLVDNYGLILDEEKYYYYYDLFASNLMPDIAVTAKERGQQ